MSLIKKVSHEGKRLVCLSFLLFLPVLLDFIKVYVGGDSSIHTYIVYITSLLFILFVFRKDMTIKTLGVMLLFYFLFGISYLLFPETREFYSSNGFIILCLYFVPVIFLVVREIRDWSNFFIIMSWFGIFAVLMGLFIVFFSGVDNYSADERYFTYMEFSYAQLPFVCSLYKCSKERRPLLFFPFFALGLLEMFAFGSRASLLFAILFVFLIEFINRISNFMSMMILIFIIFLLVINLNSIIDWLASISGLGDSYVLRHILSGDLFAHDTRDIIYSNCRNRINTMGLEVSGFYGDRRYCGDVYPHNIIYEVLMQWGWIIGSLILLYLLFLIIRSFRNKDNYPIAFFLLCCLLGRYFVSGTYVIEGRFWIFYACLLALSRRFKII